MNRLARWSLTASMLIVTGAYGWSPESTSNLLAAKLEVASASAGQSAIAMTAWKNRDPDLFMSIVPKDFRFERPDGTVMTWQSLYDRQKHQMAALKHIDRFVVTIAVESVNAESAVVLSTQDWTRVVVSDGKDARFKTGVTHREMWKKTGGQWRMESLTEHDQTREELGDASIKDRDEFYEIQISLTDPMTMP